MNKIQNADAKYILIVDDIVENLHVLSNILQEEGYVVRCARNGKSALQSLLVKKPDLILLDIQMPDMNGYEICQKLKQESTTQNIPVIFISALDAIDSKVRGFEVGGVDYITKPFQMQEILARVESQLVIQLANRKISRLNQQLQEQVKKEQQKTQELGQINSQLKQEIVAREKAEQQLVYDTLHDSLTKLPNRNFLMKRIDRAIESMKSDSNYSFALLFLDLNRFKIINDTLGHSVGDQLLVAFANLLNLNLSRVHTVARLGGDEFVILLDRIKSIEHSVEIVECLLETFAKPLHLDNVTLSINASIGIVLGLPTYENSSQILRDADIAMYQAKNKGKGKGQGQGQYEIFNRSMYLKNLKLIELERDLRLALPRKELFLYYQPIISLENNELEGFEALVRWQHPLKGFISPEEFIPLAEDTGLILPLGEWVLQEACRQLVIWQQEFSNILDIASIKISINIASQQLQEVDFISKLDKILLDTGIEPSCIKLEITERILIESEPITQNNLTEIRKRNIKLSIDDFGTGYSSLSYLRRLPIDHLKIDRSFIDGINSDLESLEIVKTIITLAHNLGMEAIAEGVETLEQARKLKDLGCELAQGYLFARPLPAKEIKSKLTSFTQPILDDFNVEVSNHVNCDKTNISLEPINMECHHRVIEATA